jgi:hypothetical protein
MRAAVAGCLVPLLACGLPPVPAEPPGATVDIGVGGDDDGWVDDEGRSVATDEPKVRLSPIQKELRIRVHARGHSITVDGVTVARGCRHTAPASIVTVPLRNGAHDFDALATCLTTLKHDNPEWRAATLSAKPGVPYAVIVNTLDILRGGPEATGFSDVAFAAEDD